MSADGDVLAWGIVTLAARIRDKTISAREYVDLLQKHGRALVGLNAFITQDFDKLTAQAERADAAFARDPSACGVLHGVPVALKDNIDTVDLPTTGGTLALKAHVPLQNAPVWQRLAAAGAVLAGKANMHELASGGSNDNMAFGRAQNPYARTCTPGGSSGGSGVVLAARLAPGALGSDTAGSVRVPAALCGVVGLRPTHGRYSNDGVVPLAPSRDTVGPMARCVDDVAVLDGVITGEHAPLSRVSPRGIRLGVDRKRFFDGADAEVLAVIDAVLSELARAGVVLVDVAAEPDRTLSTQISSTIFDAELLTGYQAYLKASAPQVTMQMIYDQIASPSLKQRWAHRLDRPVIPHPEAYRRALTEDGPAVVAQHMQMMRDHDLDALIAPTAPQAALPFGGDDSVMLGGKVVSSWLYFVNTAYAPVRGLPSVSIPVGLTKSGLPVGVLLDGMVGADRKLLSVAKAIENRLSVTLRPDFTAL